MARMKGAQHFRQRLVLSTLSNTALRIDDIRADSEAPGLCDFEASLLRLVEKISNGCGIEINETGTKLRYKPGILAGGRNLVHDCGTGRGIGYFLEPLIILGLFGKKPLSITLRGITNDSRDPCVDTFRTATLPMLKHFGVPIEGLELKVVARGAPPLGGGEVVLKVPIVPKSLTAATWVDEGMVKRIRGVSYSTRVSPHMANRMVDAARGVLNRLLPDVYIFTDHYTGSESGKSPGYGISLVAETTTGCILSSECVAMHSGASELQLPEDLGTQAAMSLLQEIRLGGVVDSTHQGLLFILCALCPEDVSKVRVGKLSSYGIKMLQHIKEFLGVQFSIKPDPATGTVLLTCVGSGFQNLYRKVS
ncbi:probable RNA 3'-terminal phosphate cyclase-like protein [Selaginella moellendorffii]|nr:probable RNA 3'-terminal phosphate cyclase-like protein [Selaginella moellendorffii]|eukprot:XP_002974064.2 probable RNA 3'-terminal phosphate cyclase-like protein [Selaginella moellendorffii]